MRTLFAVSCCWMLQGENQDTVGTPLAPIEQTAEDAGRACCARAARRGR